MLTQGFKKFSIGTKIILPYLLLTLAVAGIGAFIVTYLVTGSLNERVNNQLLDAGRVVSESMVGFEADRLSVLRLVANTAGVAESLKTADSTELANLVPQLVANSRANSVVLLNVQGVEVFGWQTVPGDVSGQFFQGRDFSQLEDVQLVLSGFEDELGNKRVLVAETADGFMLYTAGPVYDGQELVGAALVGTDLHEMAVSLTESAIARVTLYDQNGQVMTTTLDDTEESALDTLQESPQQYQTVLQLLQESPERYKVVIAGAADQAPLKQIELLNQQYLLAYGDWQVRNRSFGLFSVALPSNFIVNTAVTSRNILSLVFSLATVGVITLGFVTARHITRPINRLVEVSTAVAEGNLTERTGIASRDEVGTLASSFDAMTERLLERDRQLVEQASKLEAILQSIADGVIVFDMFNRIITSNPAAQRILQDASGDNLIRDLLSRTIISHEFNPLDNLNNSSHRYPIGSRVFSALAALVRSPQGDQLGRVVVLRDVTREAEIEQLKDGFIANVSHELRTPLTSIKGYVDFMLMTGANSLDETQIKYLKTVSNHTTQLVNHVGKLIEIAEIQEGTLKFHKKQESLNELVAGIVENWQKPMSEKGISMQLHLPDAPVWVWGDASRLTWAIDNLLRNANQYTPSDGRVIVQLKTHRDEACLTVQDTGIGIRGTDQAQLFGRFFRVQHESTFDVPGLGLGLFIVRAIVEAHNGQVHVASELGTGSTFGFTLPISEK